MGLHAASPALLTVLLALVAGTQANTLYVFDFNSDLQGWASQRGSWRWADASTLQNTIPSDYKGGFAVMDDQFDSDELYTPYFRVPRGGNFTMKFYLRSKYIQSNDLKVYTRNKLNVAKDFIDLKEYSLDDTFYWSIITKELPPDDEEVRFEIFCYNGETALPGEPLLGCAIDQIAFDVYDDNTTPAPTTTTEEPTSPPTDPPTTTEEPTNPPTSTEEPTNPPTTTEEPTNPPTTTEEPTNPPTTTEGPTNPPTTTEGPTNPPTTTEQSTDPPTTTEEPTNPPTTTEEPTNPPTTTEEPTNPPTTTEGPTNPPTTTEEPTNPPTTTEGPTNPPTTTEGPTNPPTTTEEPTNPPTTTEGPTNPPTTTEEPTNPPTTTEGPTNPPTTTEGPTNPPTTTEGPTNPPTTTEGPTNPPTTTEGPTNPPTTTEEPTNPPTTTEQPTNPPTTTEEPTHPPTTTEQPTNPPTTTEQSTNPPTTTEQSTNPPTTTEESTDSPTDPPTTTEEPTDPPTTTQEPTDPPTTTEEPTDSPTTTEGPTDTPTAPPTTTEAPTNPPFSSTTEGPAGPIFFDFEDDMNGWSLVHMNYAAFRRVTFDHDHYGVKPPPSGSMVLQVFADHVQSGTVVAKSPTLKATADTMTLRVTFWMNGTDSFPAQLKLRRQFNYDTFEDSPVMNLDSFGDQTNRIWLTYTASKPLVIGEEFSLFMEASLGGDNFNDVAVSSIEVSGVKIIDDNNSTLFDFEGGLGGWVPGKMDGGIWQLTTWDNLDPSLNIPKPEAGEKFLIASRSNIYSGVISIESPIMDAYDGMTQRLTFSFYLRGSVTYPVVLRIRMKTPDGTYDALPFVDLREYGNTDYQQWLHLDHEIEIPLKPGDTQYQLVIEVDLGSWMGNAVALDDFVITKYDKK